MPEVTEPEVQLRAESKQSLAHTLLPRGCPGANVFPTAGKSPLHSGSVRKLQCLALASVAQWIEHWPKNQRAAGSIPSQGTCLGWGPGPQGRMHER